MVRTQIYLTEEEKDGLTAVATSTDKKQSEIIREAIDRFLDLTGATAARPFWTKPPACGRTGATCPTSRLADVPGIEADIMTKQILVDTDVMVDFLRGHPKAVALVQAQSARIILPSIVATELYAGVKGDEELGTLDSLIHLFRIVPVSSELARADGFYKRDFAKSHGVGLADAIIAATAQAENADLNALNTKHYPMIKGLKPAYTKTSRGQPSVSGDD